jgi:transcriptional regulator of acetoin/glycerol metabolism
MPVWHGIGPGVSHRWLCHGDPVKDASQELATQLTAAADESDLRDAVQGFRSMERKIEISITEAVRERAVMQKIERQIDSQLRPEMLVPSFLESLHRMQVDEDGHDRLQPLQKWRQQSTASNGGFPVPSKSTEVHPILPR